VEAERPAPSAATSGGGQRFETGFVQDPPWRFPLQLDPGIAPNGGGGRACRPQGIDAAHHVGERCADSRGGGRLRAAGADLCSFRLEPPEELARGFACDQSRWRGCSPQRTYPSWQEQGQIVAESGARVLWAAGWIKKSMRVC